MDSLRYCNTVLLRQLVNKLKNEKFYSHPLDSGVVIIGYRMSDLADIEIEKAAESIVLSIRECGKDKFVKLPCPGGIENCHVATDRVSNISVRALSSFHVKEGMIITEFSVGMR